MKKTMNNTFLYDQWQRIKLLKKPFYVFYFDIANINLTLYKQGLFLYTKARLDYAHEFQRLYRTRSFIRTNEKD